MYFYRVPLAQISIMFAPDAACKIVFRAHLIIFYYDWFRNFLAHIFFVPAKLPSDY